jgi:prephenate dehydrogenase
VLAIIGVGLIGGSIGLAARRKGLFSEIRGTTRRKETLEAALSLGAVDRGFSNAVEAAEGADMVIVATGVSLIPEYSIKCAAVAAEDAVITDVGSIKGWIAEELSGRMPAGRRFVGSHPLAGSERSGVVNARDDLLDGANCIITPTDEADEDAAARLGEFWQTLGMKVFKMSPAEHDAILAAASHLPHLAAAALVEAVPDTAMPFGASGLRDTTRVAGGDASIWRDIIEANRDHAVEAIESFEAELAVIKGLVLRGDWNGLEEYLNRAKAKRGKRFASKGRRLQ